MTTSVETLQLEIKTWADSVYPTRTPSSILLKLKEELKELSDDVLDPYEYADLVILVLDLASIHDVCVTAAVREKLKINYARQWKIDTVTGVMSHIRTVGADHG